MWMFKKRLWWINVTTDTGLTVYVNFSMHTYFTFCQAYLKKNEWFDIYLEWILGRNKPFILGLHVICSCINCFCEAFYGKHQKVCESEILEISLNLKDLDTV